MIIVMHIFLLKELQTTRQAERETDERNKEVIFKNCTLFTNCKSKTNNTQGDNTKDMDVVVSMYNLIEYSDNYSKISGILWQHYNDESALNNDDNNVDFPGNSFSFKFKQKIMGNTSDDADTKVVEIAVPFKNLSNFWKIFETPLINFEINLILA